MTPTHTSAEAVAHAIAYAMIDAKMLVDPDAYAAVEALIQRHVEPLIERERLEAKIEALTWAANIANPYTGGILLPAHLQIEHQSGELTRQLAASDAGVGE